MHENPGEFAMMQNGPQNSNTTAPDEQRSSRRAILSRSLTLVGAGALVVASARWASPVSAQDEGLGAGGRQGGDDGSAASLPPAQAEGLGAGGRQGGDDGGGGRKRRDNAETSDGVGAGGRSTAEPTVMAMPKTGVGATDDAAGTVVEQVAPLLLVAGAMGAASMALKARTLSVATVRD